jgi:pantoate--beta-alanine ligase
MVKLITTSQDLIQERNSEKGSVSFVPTMGNLHAGHISLLEEALKNSEVVYFSIFVNPKQFGPHEDFNKYPRTLAYDMAMIEDCSRKHADKKIVVFAPHDPQEIYPSGENQIISVAGLKDLIEGKLRPGHFDGVATVVYRLFNLVRPKSAYFGLKDYQQYLVIRQMVKDLNLPIDIIGMPIIREPSGLALSSRNQYLSSEEKKEALVLSHALKKIADLIDGKKANLPKASREIKTLLLDPKWNYLEMRDAETLSEDLTQSHQLTLLGVYQLGSTRLLDNKQLEIR